MKKKFLLGLVAMLLPLASWAGDVTATSGNFSLTYPDDFAYNGGNIQPTFAVTSEGEALTVETDYTISYKLGTETVTTIKDAGTYTVTVTGAGKLKALGSATFNFTVKPAELTKVEVTGRLTKEYGAAYNLDFSGIVQLTGVVGTKDAVTKETAGQNETEFNDALKCLSLNPVYTTEEVGDVSVALLNKAEGENVKSNYTYKGAAQSVEIDITKKTLTLAWADKKGSSVYNGQAVSLDDLKAGITGFDLVKDKDENEDNVTLSLSIDDDAEIKDVAQYTINVALDGTDAGNYELASEELEYNVTKATLTIEATGTAELTKVYDGTFVNNGDTDLTAQYSIKIGDEDANIEGLHLKVNPADGKRGKDVGNHIVGVVYIDETGKESWVSAANYGEPEKNVESLKNYEISYAYTDSKNLYKVTARPVYYYFEGGSTPYTASDITLTTANYTVKTKEAADGEGFVTGHAFAEGKEPTATCEETIKNVKEGGYALKGNVTGVEVQDADGTTISTNNYNFILATAEDVTGVENLNVFKVTPGTLIITMKNQEIEFSDYADEEKLAEKLAEWATSNYSGMSNNPNNREDRLAIRNLVKVTVGDDIEDDEEATEEGNISGKKQLVVSIEQPEAPAEGEEASAAWIAYYNYTRTCVPGILTIKAVTLEEGLVLNASEDFVSEDEGTEDEDTEEQEPAEPVATVAELLNQYNGATVNEVKVVNLINYVGNEDENGKYQYTEADHTFVQGDWYALVLPFDVKLSELSQQLGYAVFYVPNPAKTQVGEEGWSAVYFKLTFDEIPANTMMLFRVDGSNKNIAEGLTFTNKKIVALTEEEAETGFEIVEGINYVPVYGKKTLTSNNYTEWFFRTNDSKFLGVTALVEAGYPGLNIYPFNAYITTPAPDGYNEAGVRFFIEEADGSTTEINTVTGKVTKNIADGWYTVGGVKLNAQPTQKGVYINNGKKVVIK